MRLFGRVGEGESLNGTLLSWYRTTGWFRVMLHFGRWFLYVRVRWMPEPLCVIFTRSWEIDQSVEWLPEQSKAWHRKSYVLPCSLMFANNGQIVRRS